MSTSKKMRFVTGFTVIVSTVFSAAAAADDERGPKSSEFTLEYSSAIDLNAFSLVQDSEEDATFSAGMTQFHRPFDVGAVYIGLSARSDEESAELTVGYRVDDLLGFDWNINTSFFTELLDESDTWVARLSVSRMLWAGQTGSNCSSQINTGSDQAGAHCMKQSLSSDFETEWVAARELGSVAPTLTYSLKYGRNDFSVGLGLIADVDELNGATTRTQFTYSRTFGEHEHYQLRLRYRNDDGDDEQVMARIAFRRW